ncbi:MAG: hypothetical protein PGN11_01460 [Quadrisphaera sp.]
MHDDVTPAPSRLRSGPPTGPRSAGLAVVLPPPAAAVVDLDARRARTGPVVDLTSAGRGPRSARPQDALVELRPAPLVLTAVDESTLSIQDRVRLRALEADHR